MSLFPDLILKRGISWTVDNQPIADFNQLLVPLNADAYHKRGLSRFALGDHQGAVADFSQAVQLNPNHVHAYLHRSYTRICLDDSCGALADFDQAFRIAPEVAKDYSTKITEALGSDQNALNEAYRRIAQDYLERGNSWASVGDYQKAIADYNQALTINPHDHKVYSNRGYSYYLSGNLDLALKDYNTALELNSDINTYLNRAAVYVALNDYWSAIEDYNQTVEIDGNNIEAYLNRGKLWSFLEATTGNKRLLSGDNPRFKSSSSIR